MPLNKLDNFIKNTEGRILYVNPNDLDSTDSIENQGNSLARPFKTVQRALLEAARFSYVAGDNNDLVEKTTILLFPGEHLIDNRPGFAIYDNAGAAYAVSRAGGAGVLASSVLSLGLDSNFDLTQEDNILYKFNSYYGGVVVPRGTSIVGLDLRKTKIRPKYVPNPTDDAVAKSAIFRITGACYFWQFSLFDGDSSGVVYTNPDDFGTTNQSTPNFSHHKLTCFEFCDGVNNVGSYGLTDLDMYYSKVSNAYNAYRDIDEKYPADPLGFAKRNPEWEIVGAFTSDRIEISSIISGNGSTASSVVTVTTSAAHNLNAGTPIKIRGVGGSGVTAPYNISTTVQNVLSSTSFTYLLPALSSYPTINPSPSASGATVTVETDTVSGASPYIFNISLRSVWGMNGLHADGSKASGFRSTVVAQFTAVSLQKDDRAFVKYSKSSRTYQGVNYTTVYGSSLPEGASQTNSDQVYHLDPDAVYRQGWETSHIKISNDAFIQIVSVFAIGFNKHFDAESGGDGSITNSNSNFGQISLNSSGFKRDAFDKDNNAFITSIIPPRAIIESEDTIEWLSLDVGLTTSVGISSHLYLYGFTSADSVPSSLTQGYRIGARLNDTLSVVGAGVTYSASIYMCDNSISTSGLTTALGTTSSVKSYDVTSGPTSNSFTIGTNNLLTGEKVIIISDDGDLPENIDAHQVYYVINNGDNNTIKLASSYTNATQSQAITVYGGTNLHILSRVSDKDSGDLGSPVQFDAQNNNWFIHVNAGNGIYSAFSSGGTATYGTTTDLAYVNRISDERSLDEKLYKFRVVIPKELANAKDPESGFVIQESSSTGARNNADFTRTSIASTDYAYNKNPRFIATCSVVSSTVTVLAELPHDLQVGNIVVIRNVTSSTNAGGTYNEGYNGRFTVTEVTDAFTFKHSTTDVDGKAHTPGTFTNNVNTRSTSLPRFERNDWQGNLFVYRNEVISPYIYNQQDGIYHLYVLNASNAMTQEFTNLEFGQLPSDLYPQLDRDNINSNPPAAKTFAKRAPIGAIVTNDLKKSITRESTDLALKDIGIGLTISSVASSSGIATITFSRFHGLSGIATGTITAGASYTDGTYYNVKLLNGSQTGTWNGATAKVVVTGGAVVSADIIAPGSGYSAAGLYFDQTIIGAGNGNARYTTVTSGITTNVGDVVQITGTGTISDGYYRISSVPSSTTIAIAKTAGDPTISSSQYVFVVGSSIQISSSSYSATTGTTTFVTSSAHGLLAGNRFRVIDSSNNNLGDYLVDARVSATSFTAVTNASLSAANGYILKHGLSSNEAISDTRGENFGSRQVSFFANETFTLTSAITTGTTINISSSGIGTAQRLPLGSYIQIDNEIMRVTSSNNVTSATVLRGAFGTVQESHDVNSLIRKINPVAIEFHRPSILRASGHTFEYLGYGPGNYSTGLPQVQVKSLNDQENFLANSQERSCGVVVYTGMNNNGDFFNGNTKTSASSGEVTSYDIPNPTITGEDPNKLSVVFDEVTIKERLLVEGGDSGQILSQFDGPVTFNKEVRTKAQSTFSGKVRITNTSSDALNVSGGAVINNELVVNTGIVPDTDEGAYLGTAAKPFSDAHIGEVRVAQTDDNTIDTATGNLKINATTGSTVAIQTNTTITGNLDLTTAGAGSAATAGRISANYLDVPNISPVGSIIMWPGTISNFPSDWALCNGSELSIATYNTLYNVLTNSGAIFPFGANTNGSGAAGSTHFRLPDLRDRFVSGSGSSYSVGDTGGLSNVTLTTSEMPVHNHTITDPGHNHASNQDLENPNSGGITQGPGGRSHGIISAGSVITQSNTTGITIANAGGTAGVTQAHENRPPYLALIYLIRIQ
jgi:microcystin-dependent protein